MELKDVSKRLEIIKLSISIHDTDTIELQSKYLKKLNNLKINEILSLLYSKNYRQALYLIKKFKEDNNIEDIEESPIIQEEKEYVLNVDDMLKMSPIAKETINQFKESTYSADDLEAFSKNIATRRTEEDTKVAVVKEAEVIELPEEDDEDEPVELKYATKPLKEETQEEKESKEVEEALKDANKDTPLDEISSKVIKKETKKKRTQVISSYKTLRSKFAKKDATNQNEEEQQNSKQKKQEAKKEKVSLLDKLKSSKKKEKKEEEKDSKPKQQGPKEPKDDNKESKESVKEEPKKAKEDTAAIATEPKNDMYPPIPHLEEKFRQAFVLYPPLKESEIWVEEVAKLLKHITNNSYTDLEINDFMKEYNKYIEKQDIMRASQLLLLASCTDAKYPQFMLARELFRGKVLKRNIKKSFELMRALANQGYPDAICDLGQFYEYGIGMPEDKKVALKLYEKAFELGLQRATKHINRVKESQSGGFLGVFKKLIK